MSISTVNEVFELIKDKEIKMVDLRFTDPFGLCAAQEFLRTAQTFKIRILQCDFMHC